MYQHVYYTSNLFHISLAGAISARVIAASVGVACRNAEALHDLHREGCYVLYMLHDHLSSSCLAIII